MTTLFEKMKNPNYNVDVGTVLTFNGGFFSDCSFFTLNKEYKVKLVTPYSIKVSSNFGVMWINIYPNGLKAFDVKEEK